MPRLARPRADQRLGSWRDDAHAPWIARGITPEQSTRLDSQTRGAARSSQHIQVGPEDASDGTVVYPPAGQSFVWDEPPMATFSPPLAFDGDSLIATAPGFGYRLVAAPAEP